jgi:hypothetical protein
MQLQQLERQVPGASARLLSEAILQLSISDIPQLSKLLAAARSIFGPRGGGSGGGGGSAGGAVGSSLSSLPSAATPGGLAGRTGVAPLQFTPGGLPAAGGAVAAFDGGKGGSAGPGPDLGLLGNFLLARWREDAARSAAAGARSRTVL